ncbi:MAG: PKD domain-containing protein, partial [Dehalococcoidia bacterium]
MVAAALLASVCGLLLGVDRAAAQPGALSISAGGPYAGQVGDTIIFMPRFDLGGRPPDTAIAIEWNFGDGATDEGQTTAHVYGQPGTYTVTVTLIVLAGRQSATDSTTATVSAAQPQDERFPLPTGCNNVVLTWPVGTPLGTVANAVSPPGVVQSIFRLDPVQQRFLGFSPSAPSFANDYTMVETSLEAVFFCVTAPGTLVRPASGGSPTPAPSPVGPVFRWQETLLSDGQRFTPADPSLYTLQLFPDGRAAAQVDCNRSVGSYALSGDQLTISLQATTLAA